MLATSALQSKLAVGVKGMMSVGSLTAEEICSDIGQFRLDTLESVFKLCKKGGVER